MLSTPEALTSKEFLDSLYAKETEPGKTAYPVLGSGQMYIVPKDDVQQMVPAFMVNSGEFASTTAQLSEAQSRQAAMPVPAPVYDTNTGNKYVFSGGTWALSTTASLWTDFTQGTLLFNPNTNAVYYYMYVGSAMVI